MKIITFTILFAITSSNQTSKTIFSKNQNPKSKQTNQDIFHKSVESDPKKTMQTLPESFDWRDIKPECIHKVRSQETCGSDWAHVASDVLANRFCIHSDSKVNVILSPQHLVDCDYFDYGCLGGHLTTPFIHYSLFGANTEDCYGEYTSGTTGMASRFCFLTKWSCKPYYAELRSIKRMSDPQTIKKEIYLNGPVGAGLKLYEDFRDYHGQVYRHTYGDLRLNSHKVKILGWGSEDGTEYWIGQNSWGDGWGNRGFFKIAFGECEIDSGVISVMPSL